MSLLGIVGVGVAPKEVQEKVTILGFTLLEETAQGGGSRSPSVDVTDMGIKLSTKRWISIISHKQYSMCIL